MSWFEVDQDGLRRLLARRGKAFVLHELVQNAWDERVTHVDVTIAASGRGKAVLRVEDDSPDGFRNLAHAYTLFADSDKKSDAERRGRFNFGEKMVLACCETASVATTTGTIEFSHDGRRRQTKDRRDRGSVVTCVLSATRADVDEILEAARHLIPPAGIETYVNDQLLARRTPLATASSKLKTEVADEDGYLRRVYRDTTVEFYEPADGETATIYEMGIPVVETGDRYHANVMQKVPLTLDRDNVPPAYLQALRVLALKATSGLLEAADATTDWVRAAAGDQRTTSEAITRVMDLRFGDKRVAFDMSDREANKMATAAGYAVVHGGALSRGEWDNAKRAEAILPAGKVTPSKPTGYADSEHVPRSDYTDGMRRVEKLCEDLARRLMRVDVAVKFFSSRDASTMASYGSRTIQFNVAHLGNAFFDYPRNREEVVDLIIHEFGHEYESDHLSRNYYHALTRLAGKAVELALTDPEVFA